MANDQALQTYPAVPARDDAAVADLMARAVALHRQGRPAEAERLYREVASREPDHFDARHMLGILLIQGARFPDALEQIREALRIRPGDAAALCSQGKALRGLGRPQDAVNSHDRALEIDPASVDALCHRGHALRDLQRWQDAVASYDAALRIHPDQIEALYHRGDALVRLERLEEAVASYDGALRIRPDFPEPLFNRGNALFSLDRLEEAVASYDQALRLRPDDPRFLNNRGNALRRLERLPEALSSFDRALQITPDYADAYSNRGNVLQALKRMPEAVTSYDRALALNPNFADAYCNRGVALETLHRLPEALADYDRALEFAPDHAQTHNNRGTVLLDLNRPLEALASFERAFAIDPDYSDAHLNAGMCRLLLGNLKAGWEEFEWRWRTPALEASRPALEGPTWSGKESLQGKTILLWCEQGLGDSIQFCRFARLVSARGATVLLWVHSSLETLLAGLDEISRILKFGEHVPMTDYHCPLLSLPHAFNIDLTNIPADRQYLYVNPERMAAWSARLGPRRLPRVGLAWSGNPDHKNDRNRSIPLEQMLRFVNGPFEFVCLHKEVRDDDRPFLEQRPDIGWVADALTDFQDTAALVRHMDLVITVDTSIAHLAGALGRPVWILLPFVPDWRWLLGRDDSPWYPTARLFRQPAPGDWHGVFEQITAALAAASFDEAGAETVQTDAEMAHAARVTRQRNGAAVPTLLTQAVAHHREGRLANAEAAYREVLTLAPANFDALHMLGVLNAQQFNYPEAIALIGRALEARPDDATACCNLGNAQRGFGRLEDAVASYDRALRIDPARLEALYNRGAALRDLGRWEEAVASYDGVLQLQPDHVDALYHRGNTLLSQNKREEAVASYDAALRIRPEHLDALWNRGNALLHLERLEDAIASYDAALHIRPGFPEAFFNRGNALFSLNRFEEAVACYDSVLRIDPEHADALNNRGNALRGCGRLSEALASYDRALQIAPEHGQAHNNRGTTLYDLKRPHEALASYARAIAINPDYAEAHSNAGMCRLLMGDLAVGWDEYEWREDARWQKGKAPDLDRPRWHGNEPLTGKSILLWSEQGLGDTIQFCRFARLVSAKGATVVLRVPGVLHSLMVGLEGVARISKSGEPVPHTDYHCPLLSLPRAFNIDLTNIPAEHQYLFADPDRMAAWSARLGARRLPRVGLAWSGSSTHRNDRNRSIPLEQYIRLAEGPFEFVCLQKEIRDSDRPFLEQRPDIRQFSNALTDFQDTAALVRHLDLVITADTSVAHVAGALGRPVWVLLPFVPDWRWMLDRDDSPWYPTMRLFRQPERGDWETVFAQVTTELNAFVFPSDAPETVLTTAETARAARRRNEATVAALLAQAVARHRAGSLAEAETLYREVLALAPTDFDALHMLGVMQAQRLHYPDAIDLIGRALEVRPGDATAWRNLGNAQRGFHRLDDAVVSYDRALRIDPANVDAHCNRGHALRDLERLEDAVASYDAALQFQPDHVEALYQRGNVLFRLKRLTEALGSYGRVLQTDPDHVEALVNRGSVMLGLNWPDDALISYDRALTIDPGNVAALTNRGNALRRLRRLDEALSSFERALAIAPDDAAVHANRGYALEDSGRPTEALASYERALAIRPDEAQVHVNASLCRLLTGDFKAGWRDYEWRWELPALKASAPRHTQPLWTGAESLRGKTILLWDEQGIGDTIQFCRFAKVVAAQGATVVLGVPASLAPLMAGVEGVSRIVTRYDETVVVDYHCPLMSVPLACGIELDTIPAERQYLRCDPDRVAKWEGTLGVRTVPRVGLAWSGDPAHRNDYNRSIPLERFVRIAGGAFEFVCLQKEVRPGDLPLLQARPDVRHFGSQLEDLEDTAALIHHMDLVVSVDTAVAHLAGALGRPVWVLLPHNPDWRWLLDREDSPWYPSARLFRQPRTGDWQSVLDRVIYELAGVGR